MDDGAGAALDRLFDVAVVLGGMMDRRLAGHGLTPARAEVLWLLHGRGPMTQRELSGLLKCTPRNVTGLVDALAGVGFVVRTPHPADRRAVHVTLTDRGEHLVAGWQAERTQGATQLFAGTSAADLKRFVTVLDRVLDRLRVSSNG